MTLRRNVLYVLATVMVVTAGCEKKRQDKVFESAVPHGGHFTDDETATYPTITANSEVLSTNAVHLEIHASSRYSEPYSEFQLTWGPSDSSNINVFALIHIIRRADDKGLLLCDCSHGKGSKLKSRIRRITFLPHRQGLRIDLRKRTWLAWRDVNDHLEIALTGKEQLLFSGRTFYLD